MAKSKALIAAEAKIAALEAQLVLARTCYRELKSSITTPVQVVAHTPAPIVTRYHDVLGREWVKTRIGNRATSHMVTQ